jgi:hypothetical protein
MRVGELLTPVVAAIGRELLKGDYIRADEAPVGVQMHDGKRKNVKIRSLGEQSRRIHLRGTRWREEDSSNHTDARKDDL